MDKKNTLIIISSLIGLIIIAFILFVFLFSLNKKTAPTGKLPTAKESTQTTQITIPETETDISETATQGVLPEINTNPLEEKPDLNPADKTNPFKEVTTNPFE
jgi:flagellar basal body-associated protein FliL